MTYNPMSRDQYMQNYTDIINQQYGKAQNQITEQQQQLKPMYQQQRNATDVQAHQNSRRLSELMASRGLGRSGTNFTGMAGIQNQRMGQLADINRDQAFANTQMSNRFAELEQSRAASMAQASLGYEDYGLRAEQLRLDDAYRNESLAQERQRQLLALLNSYYSDTGKWQMPSSVKPADYLEQLFKSAGYR